MAHPRTREMFVEAKGKVTQSPEDLLDAMLANQQAAARARIEFPESDWNDPASEDANPLPSDEALTEREAITRDHFEEFETDRTWGREDNNADL